MTWNIWRLEGTVGYYSSMGVVPMYVRIRSCSRGASECIQIPCSFNKKTQDLLIYIIRGCLGRRLAGAVARCNLLPRIEVQLAAGLDHAHAVIDGT